MTLKHILYLLPTVGELSQTFIVEEINAVSTLHKVSVLSLERFDPDSLIHGWDQINQRSPFLTVIPPWQTVFRFNVFLKLLSFSIFSPKLMARFVKLRLQKKDNIYFLLWALRNVRPAYHSITHIHAHFASSNLSIAYSLSQLLNIELSVNFHGYDVREWQIDPQRLVKICSETKINFVVSSEQKNKLIDLGILSDSIEIQPVGVAIDHKTPPDYERKNDILSVITVARLHPIKNHLMALKAMTRIKEKGIEIRYTILGAGEMYEELSTYVRNNKLGDIVDFLGGMHHRSALEAMREHDVHLLTSVDEGTPTVVMEAMALRVLNVCTCVGGIPDIIEDKKTGLIVEKRNDLQLAEVLIGLSNGDYRVDEILDNARKHVNEKYLKKDIVKKKLSYM